MENKLTLPASCSLMDEQELTYTAGGSDISDFFAALGVPSLVMGVISVANLVWGVSNTRSWIQKNKKTTGDSTTDAVTLAIDGIDATIAYASKSVWNAVVTVYTAMNLTTWWPVTAIAWMSA